jgi:hypothetical protein
MMAFHRLVQPPSLRHKEVVVVVGWGGVGGVKERKQGQKTPVKKLFCYLATNPDEFN